MKNKMIITIKKRSQTGWLMWLLIMMPFLFGTLNELLGMPQAVRYVLDVAWLMLLLFRIWFRTRIHTKGMRGLAAWVIAFLALTLMVYLVQYQFFLYYLWGGSE